MPPITPRPRRLAAALALALASPLPAHADLAVGPDEAGPRIRVDGRLDEAAWAEAQVFEDFAVTQPYTLARPSTRTVVRLLSTPEGIAVGFDIEQPAAMPRLRPRLERDQRRPSDRVNVVIDFDADGRVAYDFAVLLSGSIQDDVITEERRFNPDWDGDWQWAVDEDAEGWRVEMLIPWTTATMRDANAPTREIAVYFDRVVGASEERHAFPAASFEPAPSCCACSPTPRCCRTCAAAASPRPRPASTCCGSPRRASSWRPRSTPTSARWRPTSWW
jgi:hypothetical protein